MLAVTAVIGASGCGVRPTGIVGAGSVPVPAARTGPVTVYLLRDGELVPSVRPGLPGHPYHAVTQLGVPITAAERRRSMTTAVLPGSIEVRAANAWSPAQVTEGREDELYVDFAIGGIAVTRDESGAVTAVRGRWSRLALAQVACTAEAIPGVTGVRVIGMYNPARTDWARVGCSLFRDLYGPELRSTRG
ncbi:hypothetical protein [Actinomadura viridis]|uniref:Uncharacterized protein n=1 Tax=Actinomadura viridis TaxID=58110 RepID=A0A931DII0_9ACTN|nr:hypothetical protein [Actinomadura viridis]MBG6088186.1 hypothetical protein [Actinomadura viridis]